MEANAETMETADIYDEDWTTVVNNRRPPLRAGKGRGGRGNAVSSDSSRSTNGQQWLGKQERQLADRKIFVTGLTASTKSHQLAVAFRMLCGNHVLEATICRHPDGSSKGFAFVVFSDQSSADMATREGSIRIDGKLCSIRAYSELATTAGGGGTYCWDEASATEAREEVQNFITRHELSGATCAVLRRADPKTALRVVRALSVTKGEKISHNLVHAEMNRVAGSFLSKELETRVTDFVSGVGLDDENRDRVLSIFLAQKAEEIEHVLETGCRRWWVNELLSKDNPPLWVLSQFSKFRRQMTRDDIEVFVGRFNFGDDVRRQLCELSVERSRRLMKAWNPTGHGSQRQMQKEFKDSLTESLHDFRWQRERRKADSGIGNAGNHAKILQEWSDDEDIPECPPQIPNEISNHIQGSREAASFEAFDADTDQSEFVAPPRPLHPSSSLGRGQKSESAVSASKVKRRQPKPTHFILCVDASGSMINADCVDPEGEHMTRLDAVLETCQRVITDSAMNLEDRYSFVTFNEESVLHFSCCRAFDAQTELESLRPTAKNQTMFSMGIRGIHAAIRQDNLKLPARVVFLSDGEPTDPGSYLRDVQILMKKYPGHDALKIYAVGFGESAKVNSVEGDFTYLQQLASLGHGHFQRCGATLSSLQGAFTAVTSTISLSRSASSAGNSKHDSKQSESANPSSAASNPWDLQLRPGTAEPPVIHIATIEEAAEGSDEEGDGSQPLADAPSQERAVAASQVEFELPQPNQIFCNISDGSKWKHFQAAQTTFSFDGQKFSRTCDVKRVYLRQKPFMKGGMRLVYGMLHAENKDKLSDIHSRMCAKRLFQDLDKEQGFQAHAAFCKSTAVAQYYSKLFKQALKFTDTKHKLLFLPCHLYSPISKEGGYHFCGEELLNGHFVKLNSNAGFVNEAEFSDHSLVAQAFSHFTFDKSYGALMVVDLQGVCADNNSGNYSLLTDPQVHSRGMYEKFGPGDLGDDGIRKFFHHHKCDDLCRKLGLRKEFDISPPTKTLKMPGVLGLIKHMLGDDAKGFFQDLRRTCGISTVKMPREAHSDWVDIQVWAEKGCQWAKAVKRLESRMDAYFVDARKVVMVSSACLYWDVDKWQSKLEAWRRESNASIIPYPADWNVQDGVKELWVFSDSLGAQRYRNDARDYAVTFIEEELARSEQEDPTSSPERPKESSSINDWKQYQDHSGKKYWYRSDGTWFYETDQRWARYSDNAGKLWWHSGETGDWFYEP